MKLRGGGGVLAAFRRRALQRRAMQVLRADRALTGGAGGVGRARPAAAAAGAAGAGAGAGACANAAPAMHREAAMIAIVFMCHSRDDLRS